MSGERSWKGMKSSNWMVMGLVLRRAALAREDMLVGPRDLFVGCVAVRNGEAMVP